MLVVMVMVELVVMIIMLMMDDDGDGDGGLFFKASQNEAAVPTVFWLEHSFGQQICTCQLQTCAKSVCKSLLMTPRHSSAQTEDSLQRHKGAHVASCAPLVSQATTSTPSPLHTPSTAGRPLQNAMSLPLACLVFLYLF